LSRKSTSNLGLLYVTNNPLKYTDPSGHCRRKSGTFVYAEDCTVDEFNELSWDDRRLWVETFENHHGLQGWFDDIKNAIEYLGEDVDYINPKGWAAHADAAVLQAIQNGQRLSEGKTLLGEHKGDDCLGTCLGAARGWAAFYEAEKTYRTTGTEPENLYQLRYGAEQGGVDYGVDISDKYYQEESARVRYRIREFVNDGNTYRRVVALPF